MQKKNLRIMIYLTILSVISFILIYMMELPLLPSASFLKYDLSEVIAIIAGFIFGPVAGSIVIVLKSLLFFISGKNTTGWVGLLASILAGLSLVLGSTIIYRLKKNNLSKYLGILIGTLVLTIIMSFFNYFFLLGWYGIPTDKFAGLLTGAIVPFNLIKGLLSTVIGVAIYTLLESRIDKILDKDI